MTTNILQLGSIKALIVRKLVKNLHLSVLPPSGKVRVTAPEGMKDDAIRTLLATRLPWIKKQQEKFKGQNIISLANATAWRLSIRTLRRLSL
jgi:predicted metal-dependent hydrolase